MIEASDRVYMSRGSKWTVLFGDTTYVKVKINPEDNPEVIYPDIGWVGFEKVSEVDGERVHLALFDPRVG